MTPDEILAFLTGPYLGRLATVRPDGRPHVVPVWYLFEAGLVYVSMSPRSVKASNLRRNPAVALVVDTVEGDFALAYKGVLLEGRATFVEEGQPVLRRIYRRYLGEAGLNHPMARWMLEEAPNVVICFRPDRITAWDNTRSLERFGRATA